MASAVYPLYKQALLGGDADIALDTGTVRFVLVDTGTYTYSAAHQFYSDLSGIAQSGAADAETTITGKTIINGVFDTTNDTTETAALDATATTYEALVIYIDTGNPATSRLVCYVDGFSAITPNGGTATINWDDGGGVLDGIFAL